MHARFLQRRGGRIMRRTQRDRQPLTSCDPPVVQCHRELPCNVQLTLPDCPCGQSESGSSSSMAYLGGCLCGAVRYSAAADPIATRVCWCRDCQYLAAGSATVNLVFMAAAVSISGPLRGYSSVADSGNTMHRQFCERCGTPVTSASEERPHLLILRAGTLDDPEIAKPSLTIWTASAPAWACIDENTPSVAGQPPPAA